MDHINETYINTSAKPILRWFFLPSIPAGERQSGKAPIFTPCLVHRPFCHPFHLGEEVSLPLCISTLQSNQGKKHGEKLRICRRNLIEVTL